MLLMLFVNKNSHMSFCFNELSKNGSLVLRLPTMVVVFRLT